jgi:hypothetical protein
VIYEWRVARVIDDKTMNNCNRAVFLKGLL